MISITDPQGPAACRTLIDGMMTVAHLSELGPDVVLSANMSIIMAHAREAPGSRAAIAQSLREMLAQIETGQYPTADQPLGVAAAGQQLH
jgi:hypothetical protein